MYWLYSLVNDWLFRRLSLTTLMVSQGLMGDGYVQQWVTTVAGCSYSGWFRKIKFAINANSKQLRETSHRVKSTLTLTLKHKTSFSPVWTECVFIAWSSSLPQKTGRLLPHPGGASSLSSNRWRSASSRSWTLPLRDDASKGGAPTWAGAGTPEGSRGDVNARRRSTKNPELQSVWELCSCRGETSRTRKHF